MTPVSAIFISLVVSIALLMDSSNLIGLLLCISLMITVAIVKRKTRHLQRLFVLTIVFAIPLIPMHGILNSSFPTTFTLFGAVPIRQDGIFFALNTLNMVGALFGVSLIWMEVPKKQFMKFLQKLHLSDLVIMIAFQAFSLLNSIEYRANEIIDAQKARGILTHTDRIRVLFRLPTIVIPLVVGLLNEVDEKSRIQFYMSSMGTMKYGTKGENYFSVSELSYLIAVTAIFWLIYSLAL